MSLAEQVQRVDGGQNAALKAIIEKLGGTVPDTTKIDGYAALIPPLVLYTGDDQLSGATKTAYDLGSDATPDDVFALIADSIENIETNQVNGAKIVTGSYVGTGSNTKTFSFPINVQILFIAETSGGYYRHFAIIQKGAAVMNDVNIEPGKSTGNSNAFPCSFNGVTLSSSGSGSPLWFNATSSHYSYVAVGN